MTTIRFSLFDSDENDPHEIPFDPFDGDNVPLLGKPKEIGYFSIDFKRNILFNKSEMKYLITPLKRRDLNLDLDINFSSDVIHNYVTLEKMYQTLFWLQYHKQILKPELPLKVSSVDFITVRGTLMLIMCTPYISGFYRNQWEICASKFNGIIYFSAIDSDIDVAENKNASLKQLKLQSWGYKFEQYVTTDHIDGIPDVSSETHQLEEYCVVLKNVLNKHTLLYKAEIDAIIPHRAGLSDTSCYTELKTTRIIRTLSEEYYFNRYKSVTWWAQSHLAGISEIICGKRTNEGIVKEIEIFQVSSLPERAQGMWSANVCLNFCDKFLNFLKKVVTEDNINVVYKFHYRSKDMIHCTKLVNPEQRYRVIPEWYKKAINEE